MPAPMNMAVIVLMILLVLSSAVYLSVKAFVLHRRVGGLARIAHAHGMLFAADDPFEIPLRYGCFTLFSAGHSQRASCVTYGRGGGRPVRAFDLRYELGHGTQRQVRHFGAMVVEVPNSLDPAMAWREQRANEPLSLLYKTGQQGQWCFGGSADSARRLIHACRAADIEPEWIELGPIGVLLATGNPPTDGYGVSFNKMSEFADALFGAVGTAEGNQPGARGD